MQINIMKDIDWEELSLMEWLTDEITGDSLWVCNTAKEVKLYISKTINWSGMEPWRGLKSLLHALLQQCRSSHIGF